MCEWIVAGRISSISKYFDTAARNSSSSTSCGLVSRCGGPVGGGEVAVAALDGQRVKQRAVHDRREAAVVAGERGDVGADERRVGQ